MRPYELVDAGDALLNGVLAWGIRELRPPQKAKMGPELHAYATDLFPGHPYDDIKIR